MINNFDLLVEQVMVYEQPEQTMRVGLYPGAFKPPHVGHYQAAVDALRKNDVVYVLISGESRGKDTEQITADQSEQIWKLYQQEINDSGLRVMRVDNFNDPDTQAISTVITATYDVVHLLNNSGDYETTGRFASPHPVAKEIYNQLKDQDNFAVTLHAGAEDFTGRYSGFPFDGQDEQKRYVGKRVIQINQGLNKRLASASGIRPFVSSYRGQNIKTAEDVRSQVLTGALKYEDFASIRKNLPGDDKLKDAVIDILLK